MEMLESWAGRHVACEIVSEFEDFVEGMARRAELRQEKNIIEEGTYLVTCLKINLQEEGITKLDDSCPGLDDNNLE